MENNHKLLILALPTALRVLIMWITRLRFDVKGLRMATETTVSERAEDLIAAYQKWWRVWLVPDDEMPSWEVRWSLKEKCLHEESH